MREHQIIINLKPEHYQELERLSRASGARSVSVFVKDRMLASLGIGGSANVANAPGSLNVAAVTADIRRLHRDLQVFVAESLSGKDFGYAGSPNEQESLTPGAELARAVAEGESTQAAAPGSVAPADKMEAPTEPVVSVDQLAPFGNPPPLSSPVASPTSAPSQSSASSTAPGSGQELAQGITQAIPSNQAIPRQQGPFPLRSRGSGAPFGSVIPGLASFRSPASASSNLDDSSNRNSAQPSESSVSGVDGAVPTNTQSASVSAPSHTGVQSTEVPDDLEELAERAFAISPRLGAMEEVDDDVPMFSDPLDELLGEIEDEEFQQAQATQAAQAALAAQSSPAAVGAAVAEVAAATSESTSGASAANTSAVAGAGFLGHESSEHINEDDASADYEGGDAPDSADAARAATEGYSSESGETHESGEAPDAGLSQSESEIEGSQYAGSEKSNTASSAVASRPNESTLSDFGQSGLDWDDAIDETNEAARNERENAANETSQSNAGTGSQDEENTNQGGTSTGFPQNPPPISGGPPPRRRRT
jgi:hypothetical protein